MADSEKSPSRGLDGRFMPEVLGGLNRDHPTEAGKVVVVKIKRKKPGRDHGKAAS